MTELRPIHKPEGPFRCCAICGKSGGSGFTLALRLLEYDIPVGQIGYAHPACIQRQRKKLLQ